jgi:hypothetical protein
MPGRHSLEGCRRATADGADFAGPLNRLSDLVIWVNVAGAPGCSHDFFPTA